MRQRNTYTFVAIIVLAVVVLAIVVFGLQAAMPEGRRPSDLIGGFHGSTETAELKAKQEATAAYERALADARAAPAADWQASVRTSCRSRPARPVRAAALFPAAPLRPEPVRSARRVDVARRRTFEAQ